MEAAQAPPAARGKVVWTGAKALRKFLVPIADLEPFPGNPRRGDVQMLRSSLRRFGQTKPILVDASTGRRIVAHHHVVLAATEEGWTHVAAIPNEFRDEEEARAYMLTDNRASDLGTYDLEDLYGQLRKVQEGAGLAATGYDDRDLEVMHRDLEAYRRAAMPPEAPPQFPAIDPGALETSYKCPSCRYEWSGNPRPGEDPEPPEPQDAG
jgi:hypothetical protein